MDMILKRGPKVEEAVMIRILKSYIMIIINIKINLVLIKKTPLESSVRQISGVTQYG